MTGKSATTWAYLGTEGRNVWMIRDLSQTSTSLIVPFEIRTHGGWWLGRYVAEVLKRESSVPEGAVSWVGPRRVVQQRSRGRSPGFDRRHHLPLPHEIVLLFVQTCEFTQQAQLVPLIDPSKIHLVRQSIAAKKMVVLDCTVGIEQCKQLVMVIYPSAVRDKYVCYQWSLSSNIVPKARLKETLNSSSVHSLGTIIYFKFSHWRSTSQTSFWCDFEQVVWLIWWASKPFHIIIIQQGWWCGYIFV